MQNMTEQISDLFGYVLVHIPGVNVTVTDKHMPNTRELQDGTSVKDGLSITTEPVTFDSRDLRMSTVIQVSAANDK